MFCGIQASLSNSQETLNPFKEEHVALFLGIHMNHMLMLWARGGTDLERGYGNVPRS